MKQIIIVSNIIILTFFSGFAQQDPQYSLNMLNHMTINPGYAGSQDAIEVNGLFRQQWMGFGGAPNTQVFNVNAPFKLFGKKHGAGLILINDIIGNFSDIGLNFSYAYRHEVRQGVVGTGIGIGFLNKSLEPNWIPPENDSDPAIPKGGEDKPMVFNLNLGVYYQTDNLFLGVSASNVNKPSVKFSEYESGTGDSYPFIKPHYYVTAGYNYQLLNPLFEIQPSMFVKTDGASTQVSINGILKYNKRFFGGISFRTVDAITLMFGMEFLNGIKFAAAYDLTTSKVRQFDDGGLEFMLGYSFSIDIDKDKRQYKSIRFL